ncbi:hypothetical protein JYU34_008976 [Plutella xylostella]|uniref:Uncharacterized protein n=2 Tax=Plutella xylostella TaxID=51655 RepID=A0ABQ7QMD8_PLUXY|nr:piggyBac transposable element-derived protein 4-like [Plutella xylostella]KAG7306351.1 hypothetical protein JYU34_008976 [Plutella xylostella]CAG9118015.1 unnamed protein product [Plutella xylostella]
MASSKPLSDTALQRILENWSDIDSDDEIDSNIFVPSPQNSFFEPTDDIVERGLERIFMNSEEVESPPTPPVPGEIEIHTTNRLNLTISKPVRSYEDWKMKKNTHKIPKFTTKFGSKIAYSHKSQPIEFFDNMFPEQLINTIVTETNRYATQEKHIFDPTNPAEIRAFLGVMIMMGLHPLPDYELYWSTDRFYNNPDISAAFSLKRFKKILENLHLNNNSTEAPRDSVNFDRLHKLRPLIDILNRIFIEQAEESTVYSVDECMVKFKGRSTMKQYMPMKPIKRGYKVWARCDAKTGYLYAFEIYTGKQETLDEAGLGFTVVTNLCQNVPRNSLVTFDNFFTSCKLVDVLYENGIFSIGTVRKTRKGLPEFMKEKPTNKREKLAKNEFAALTSEPIVAVKWLDTKEVTVLSSAHKSSEVTTVKRTQKDGTKKEVFCPKAIADYTLYMGGVDHFDHFRSSYPTGRKSRKFWMRLFFFMLDAAIINSYIIYLTKHPQRVSSHRDFRLRLARALIGDFTCKKQRQIIFKNKRGGNFGVPDEIRLQSVGIHFPEAQDTYKRCKFCSTKKETKRSNIKCSCCGVSLCTKGCFKKFHMALNPESL